MKEQKNPTTAEIVSESVEHEERNRSKTFVDSSEAVSNAESDEDSGYQNASDASVDACDDDTSKSSRSSSPDEFTIPTWALKIPSNIDAFTDEEVKNLLEYVDENLGKIPDEKSKRKWLLDSLTKGFGEHIPPSLLEIAAAQHFHGDTGISMDVRPEWLDLEKFRRGQKFASDNLFGVTYAELLSLFMVFSFEDGLKPIIATEDSSTPYAAFKRYLSTASRIKNWYTSDPWTPGTPAYIDVKAVRKIHALVRSKVEGMSQEEYKSKSTITHPMCPALKMVRRDFESTCPAPAPGQCPYTVFCKFPQFMGKSLTQGEMASTQFSFVALVILYPEAFGIHYSSDDDLDAYCHLWRGLGYLLGIDDEYNFCRGTLEDVKVRSKDFMEYWVKPNFRIIRPEWEHMIRCVIEGGQYYVPGTTYETCLLDLTEIMNLHMPRLHSSLTFVSWIRHRLIRLFLNYGSRFSGFRSYLNCRMARAVERGKKFDDEKHKQLQQRSAKTLESYKMMLQKTEVSV